MNSLKLKTITLSLIVFTLSACGGGSSSSGSATIPSPTAVSSISCAGAVKELFVAIQGTYKGTADPAFITGAGNPLTTGTTYPVTISAQDCSIRFTGSKEVKYAFAFNDPANNGTSNFVGFSGNGITANPEKLDLTGSQYNIGIKSSSNTIELERRIAKNAAGESVTDGDLHLLSVAGANSFGALHLKVASKQ